MIALAIICALLIGALVLEKRQNAEREKEWGLERTALLNRIQAPESAPFLDLPVDEEPQHVHFDDDDHFAG